VTQPPPARPGDPEAAIDTPALVLDLDAFEANLATMQHLLEGTGARLRAHAKTHKSAVVAHRQAAFGAIGQCVQKVAEAEALVHGGVADVLVTNQVASAPKLARLASLARIAEVGLCADDPAHVDLAEAAAAAAGVRLKMLVEIEVGSGRCGVAPGEEAVALAERIAASRHLRFGGLQAYHGRAQHIRAWADRQAAIAAAIDSTRRTVDQLRQHGLACDIVGGAGSGSFVLEAASGVFNEVQAGSYVFMDADYGAVEGPDGAAALPFRQALFVQATVISQPRAGFAVLDAGHKAVPLGWGFARVAGRPDLKVTSHSDEHGNVEVGAGPGVRVGDWLRLVPPHCDPTVDRYDWYVGVRNGVVESVWPITARGAMG
jgi:D-serine deaminase-like pyridoxal phosphate-dependent protein